MTRGKGNLLALRNYKWCECNECTSETANATGIPESTLGTISKQTHKVEESCKSIMAMTTIKFTEIGVPIMDKLERMVA